MWQQFSWLIARLTNNSDSCYILPIFLNSQQVFLKDIYPMALKIYFAGVATYFCCQLTKTKVILISNFYTKLVHILHISGQAFLLKIPLYFQQRMFDQISQCLIANTKMAPYWRPNNLFWGPEPTLHGAPSMRFLNLHLISQVPLFPHSTRKKGQISLCKCSYFCFSKSSNRIAHV